MKRLRFYNGYGDGRATITSGQILSISMVPNATAPNAGSYLSINQSKAIFVPSGNSISLEAQELGFIGNDAPIGDRYPGEQQIEIIFGTAANPPVDLTPTPPIGGPPVSWLVVVNVC